MKLPPSYDRDAIVLAQAIQEWIERTSKTRLPDLRFHDWGTICYIGPLHGEALDHLAASADAREMLEWADVRSGRKATLLMACAVLEQLGIKRPNTRRTADPRRAPN